MRHEVTRIALALLLVAMAASGARGDTGAEARLLRVPQDFLDVQDAIDYSRPGDLILLDRGSYLGGWEVPSAKSGITIRGIDRNEVRIHGQDERTSVLSVFADDVTIENMTAHNFLGTAFFWSGVRGFAGRYLTVYRVGGHGLHAHRSRDGTFDHVYVNGTSRAGYAVSACDPCNTTIDHVTGRHSEVGFSGTNASGIAVEDSLFEYNGSGIIVGSFDTDAHAPQRLAEITHNTVFKNGVVPTPSVGDFGGYIGIGIAIAGGQDNLVFRNLVTKNRSYGIVVFASVQESGGRFAPSDNVVERNTLRENGTADLGLGTGFAEGNCFDGNTAGLTLPRDVEATFPCSGRTVGPQAGSGEVTADLSLTLRQLDGRRGPRLPYDRMSVADLQPNLPGAANVAGLGPAYEDPIDRRPYAWIALGVAALAGAGLMVPGYRRRSARRYTKRTAVQS